MILLAQILKYRDKHVLNFFQLNKLIIILACACFSFSISRLCRNSLVFARSSSSNCCLSSSNSASFTRSLIDQRARFSRYINIPYTVHKNIIYEKMRTYQVSEGVLLLVKLLLLKIADGLASKEASVACELLFLP